FGTTRNVLQGFFLAPYIVSQAVMGAIFCSRAFEKLGYDVLPKVTIPWYVIGFFITCALFSMNIIPQEVSVLCKEISNKLEIIA
ncbi:putative sulfate exporter family transporter, partial [Clostridioides difficile]